MCALLLRFDFIIRILLFALFIVFLCLLKMINELVIVACDKRSSFQHTCIGPFARVHTESYAIRIFNCSFLYGFWLPAAICNVQLELPLCIVNIVHILLFSLRYVQFFDLRNDSLFCFFFFFASIVTFCPILLCEIKQ